MAPPAAATSGSAFGFKETFALADDRERALGELISGTEDYYVYHLQHLLNIGKGNSERADKLFAEFAEHFPYSDRKNQLETRRHLLSFDGDSKPRKERAVEYLRDQLNTYLYHERQVTAASEQAAPAKYPSVLDSELLDTKALAKTAMDECSNWNMSSFRMPEAVEYVAEHLSDKVVSQCLRKAVESMKYADFPGAFELIKAELTPNDFGNRSIHAQLPQGSLDALSKAHPSLLNHSRFVDVYLSKLRPAADVNLDLERSEREAYIARLWDFVILKLGPTFNALKANVYLMALQFDREVNKYDSVKFIEYLKLPKRTRIASSHYHSSFKDQSCVFNTGVSMSEPYIPTLRDDTEIVSDFLYHFFSQPECKSFKPYDMYLDQQFLVRQYAMARITSGESLSDSSLTPSEAQELRDRVDLEFATNKTHFSPGDVVELLVYTKNIDQLILKEYDINTRNYYQSEKSEVGPSINLDGIVANRETVHKFTEPPARRVLRKFQFPNLVQRGVHVIELIGAGLSARAIVRVGSLTVVERRGVAGHVFSVLDEKGARLSDRLSIKIGNQTYEPESEADVSQVAATSSSAAIAAGEITVPYAASTSQQAMLVTHDNFTTLVNFTHCNESYDFSAAFLLERESLIAGNRTAKVLIRPQLFLNSLPISLSVLDTAQTQLIVTLTDDESVPTVRRLGNIRFKDDEELVHEFAVADGIREVRFELTSVVQHTNGSSKSSVSASDTLAINTSDASSQVEDIHLRFSGDEYSLHAIGKGGEPLPKRVISLEIAHALVTRSIHVSLQTDANGAVSLGPLNHVLSVSANIPGISRSFELPRDSVLLPPIVHAKAGENILVALPSSTSSKQAHSSVISCSVERASLLSVKGDRVISDVSAKVRVDRESGYFVIAGLPRGDYILRIRSPCLPNVATVEVKVSDGRVAGNKLIGATRHLQLPRKRQPLQLAVTSYDHRTGLTLKVTHASSKARIHISRPQLVSDQTLSSTAPNASRSSLAATDVSVPASQYTTAKKLGEEQQYIIDRKYAKRFPGNMLQKPSLLLNPYAVRKADSRNQDARAGDRHVGEGSAASMHAKKNRLMGKRERNVAGSGSDPNLDFLTTAVQTLTNLRPDPTTGLIHVSPDVLAQCGLGDRIVCAAIDDEEVVVRHAIAAPANSSLKTKDRSLADALAPTTHFVEQKEVATVQANESFVVQNIRTSKIEVYDSLDKAYRLLSAISNSSLLQEFNFVLEWPTLSQETKLAKFSQYACHELAFFLYKKDRPFFDSVVRSYYSNKKEKTFLDHWLVGHDLSWFLDTYAYSRLNVVERILLAERVAAERGVVALNTKHGSELVPVDPERWSFLFKAAIQGGSMDGNDEPPPQEAVPMEIEFNSMSVGGGGAAMRSLAPSMSFGAPAPMAMMARGGPPMMAKRMAQPMMMMAACPPPPPPGMAMMAMDECEMAADDYAGGYDEDSSDMEEEAKEAYSEGGHQGAAPDDDDGERDLRRRVTGKQRALFRRPPPTEEYAENNYYKIAKDAHNASLITPNAFWSDYAAFVERSKAGEAFVSVNLALATRSLTEMLMALAVLDVPFTPAQHERQYQGEQLTLRTRSAAIIYTRQVRETPRDPAAPPVQAFVKYFDPNEREGYEGSERVDKFVTQFLSGSVYGAQVVVTNLSGSTQKVEVLLQIPQGAVPLQDGFFTRTRHLQISPYSTSTCEYQFYFPKPGTFTHYPPHVTKRGRLLSYGDAAPLVVQATKTVVDQTSWANIAADGTLENVVAFLQTQNLGRVDLSLIAWRMRESKPFQEILSVLRARRVFDHSLWGYSLQHFDLIALSELLQHSPSIIAQVAPRLTSTLLTFTLEDRGEAQMLEYHPFFTPRIHQLGRRDIFNDSLKAAYVSLLNAMVCCATPTSADLFALTYYLLLQSRIEEAISTFAAAQLRVKEEESRLLAMAAGGTSSSKSSKAGQSLAPPPGAGEHQLVVRRRPSFSAIPSSFMRLQREYLEAYLDFYNTQPDVAPLTVARKICAEHKNHPIARWRSKFADMARQIDEYDAAMRGDSSSSSAVASPTRNVEGDEAGNIERQQAQLASTDAVLNLEIATDGTITIEARNAKERSGELRFYPSDVELLFSTNPFVRATSAAFAYIKPHLTLPVSLPATGSAVTVALPKELLNGNVFVEVVLGNLSKSTMFYSNGLTTHLMENYGQVRVVERASKRPIASAYVKVYAKLNDGTTKFYKDGYTDLRGLFDYVSLSNDVFDSVKSFAVLVMSDKFGSVVLEASRPLA
ncbi:hypothetical protein CAOG_06416 [Capsaspora owczarzaki ATCC 30864]|uniref:Uncharacterized protein n=1 Tax=Capsaspora owczarzaki (strain ATCC 30864) TaxID=595528 RepID=A0A0D2VWT0_CAPO3|nr:hypothetical protein CAOG_06416 [Capsaspora owczarzaki ATCC 30864]KJE96042.1 hypothetical protein CAOG_006416 [Capsaspora owczarzaki ATCC 30864]|eukprot:XP_004345165.2 hypothetical protein CAOG_06416 [Capsaspora owczarzaki ATCC 30864]